MSVKADSPLQIGRSLVYHDSDKRLLIDLPSSVVRWRIRHRGRELPKLILFHRPLHGSFIVEEWVMEPVEEFYMRPAIRVAFNRVSVNNGGASSCQ